MFFFGPNGMSNRISKVRHGSITPIALFAFGVLGMIGVGVYFLFSGGGGAVAINPILTTVEKGEFVAQVLDQGEIQSSENVEIRCEVRARNGTLSVIELVPEGTRVESGDFLVRLDSTAFEKELETQKISVANAQTSVIQAEAELKTATESLKEYEQGLFVEKKKLIENDIYDSQSLIETAKQELTQAKAVLEHSKKLQGKGFITSQQLEANGFEVTRSEFALKTANNKLELAEKQLEVLNNITRIKETVQLKSDIEAAKVKLSNQRESLAVEENKLDEIETQISKCEIIVPSGVEGQVVYAKESSRRGDDWILEEGAEVRERQVVIRLPNPDKMEVKAMINEQSITQISPGMPTSIQVDALGSRTLNGVVTKVNQYAESNGWMSSNIRKYAVLVEIIDPPTALKPGMNASVSIEVRSESDAVQTPIQTIYAVQDRHFCLVKKGEDAWETREVEVDGDNSQVVLIESGLEPGEQLAMNPGAFKELMDLPELELERKIAVSDKMKTRIAALTNGGKAENNTDAVGQTSEESGSDAKSEKRAGGPGRGGPGAGRGGAQGGGRGGRPGGPGGGGRRGGGGGGSGFSMPASGKALIKEKDTDGDGKLTKDEAGTPYSYFFDRVDTDSDGFLNEKELDTSIRSMKKRMEQGGFGGGGGSQ